MTPEKEQYYEDLVETMSTKGWRRLTDEAIEEVKNMQEQSLAATSWEQVCEIRGYVKAMNYIANLRQITLELLRQERELEEETDGDV